MLEHRNNASVKTNLLVRSLIHELSPGDLITKIDGDHPFGILIGADVDRKSHYALRGDERQLTNIPSPMLVIYVVKSTKKWIANIVGVLTSSGELGVVYDNQDVSGFKASELE